MLIILIPQSPENCAGSPISMVKRRKLLTGNHLSMMEKYFSHKVGHLSPQKLQTILLSSPVILLRFRHCQNLCAQRCSKETLQRAVKMQNGKLYPPHGCAWRKAAGERVGSQMSDCMRLVWTFPEAVKIRR